MTLIVEAFIISGLALTLYVLRPDLRRQMCLAGLLAIPVIVIKPLLTPHILEYATANGGIFPFFFLRGIIGFSLGAIAASLYEVTLHKTFSTPGQHRRSFLWLAVGLILFLTLRFIFHQPIIIALISACLVDLIIILIWRRDLIWETIYSGCGFGLIYALLYWFTSSGIPGQTTGLWLSDHLSGLHLLSLPIEELGAAVLLGALLGPLYAAVKDERVIDLPTPRHLWQNPKFWFSLMVVLVFVSSVLASYFLFFTAPQAKASERIIQGQQSIRIEFSKPVKRRDLKLRLNPNVEGTWAFSDSRYSDHLFTAATFTPDEPLDSHTTYVVSVDTIKSAFGRSGADTLLTFSASSPKNSPLTSLPLPVDAPKPTPTPTIKPAVQSPRPISKPVAAAPTTILNIAQDFQDRALSCEAAALKMALAGKGVSVSENDIMNLVGFDPTVHDGNVWGNPNTAFVGSIDGKQNTTGYGVYWDPIAKAASHWRSAKAFSGWSARDLSREIAASNPIVIWGTIGNAYAETWITPDNQTIHAWKGEHARTVIGFKGSADNPTAFIINDPYVGRITWTTSQLNANWSRFNYSGVVIY